MTVKVKDWGKFQHFKDRKPPWIKLYRDLLDDIQWHELAGDDAKVLVMIWLLASENDGCVPPVKELAFRLRLSEKAIKTTVSKLSHWLVQDDINVISDDAPISERYQEDVCGDVNVKALTGAGAHSLETETETETETEKTAAQAPARFVLPEWINREHWDVWHSSAKRRKANDAQKLLSVKKLSAWRDEGADFAGALENAALAGNQGLFLPSGRNSRACGETAYARNMREKYEVIAPSVAARNPNLRTVEVNPTDHFELLVDHKLEIGHAA